MERAVRKPVSLLDGVVTLDLLVNERSGHVAYIVWPSTFHVISFLSILALEHKLPEAMTDPDTFNRVSQRLLSEDSKTRRLLFAESRRKQVLCGVDVLELGAGTGVLGLGLHALGARVVVTDQTKCLELLAANVNSAPKGCLNMGGEQATSTTTTTLACAALDWKEWKASPLHGEGWRKLFSSSPDAVTDARLQLLVACDCVYDTSHIGKSPLIQIVSDFLTGPAGPPRTAIFAMETRDADIESNFEYQLGAAGLRVAVAFEAPCLHPSEGNETPPSAAKYRILVVVQGSTEIVE